VKMDDNQIKELSETTLQYLCDRGYVTDFAEVSYFINNSIDEKCTLTAVQWADRLGRLMNEEMQDCPKCGLSRNAGFGDNGCEKCGFGAMTEL